MKMSKNRWDYKNVKSIIRIFMFVVLFVLRFFNCSNFIKLIKSNFMRRIRTESFLKRRSSVD